MRTARITAYVLSLTLVAFTAFAGLVTVTNVTAVPRADEPTVDISYDLLNPSGGVHTVLINVSTNAGATYLLSCTNFSGDIGAGVTAGTNRQVVWCAAGDLPNTTSAISRVRVMAMEGTNNYCIVDISGGQDATNYPVSYQSAAPALDDTHKTTKIVLRKMPSGSFTMGSPSGELGRYSNETQHNVVLTEAFYMGIYEITQAQYSNVVGANPSSFTQGAYAPKRPVENVSWTTIRGGTWPTGTLDGTTFMGKLRAKTAALAFDLPTEAQWEYACRAGTIKALNNNTDLTSTGQDPNMEILGRYWYNGGSAYSSDPVNGGTSTAGSYLANQWGLYDLHGNVWEWCLDWWQDDLGTGDVTDPPGAGSSSGRVGRGGGWGNHADRCRSADRFDNYDPDYTYDNVGFRLSLPAGQWCAK